MEKIKAKIVSVIINFFFFLLKLYRQTSTFDKKKKKKGLSHVKLNGSICNLIMQTAN